jgi:lipopolysaccharide export system permease protein
MAEKNLKAQASTTRKSNTRQYVFPILDSYLFWGFLGNTLRGLCWFSGLFLAFAVVSGAQKVAQSGVPFMAAVEAIALQMPRIIMFTIPASLLFGAVSNFVEMSAKGEVTATMAGGMSVPRLMRAPMILTVFLAILMFWLQETVVPGAELRKGQLMVTAASKIAAKGFKIVDLRSDGAVERVVQAKSFNPEKKELIEPRIQIFRQDNTVQTEIAAQRGFWDDKRKVWIFQDGIIRTNPDNKNVASVKIPFTETSLEAKMAPDPVGLKGSIRGAREQIERKNYEMVSWQQLKLYRTEKLDEFAKSKGAERKELRKEVRSLTYGIHDKFAMPLVALGMVLVGIPLGIRPQRTASPGMAMGLSLIVMLSYYMFWVLCTNIGKAGIALPNVVAYLPVVALFTVGSILIAKKS